MAVRYAAGEPYSITIQSIKGQTKVAEKSENAQSGEKETLGFQTEVRQLLHLMIHSLYSNKEIFLRELISNASDAADKLRFEALANAGLLEDAPDLEITVSFDADDNTLTVEDNGIGMSRSELIENLGTIARSGTAEFLTQMTGDSAKDAQLIGQFGVGFYSAFIVADKVVVESRRAGLSADEAVRWESDGQGEFSVQDVKKSTRGTRVTLSLKSTDKEFVEPLRLENLIRKYSDHIGFPVKLVKADDDVTTVNSATALWTVPRAQVKEDEYKEFYKHLSHDFEDPLSWSHNRVEGKREYTSLLYVPARAPFDLWNRDAPRGLKLYVQRVFIMDDAEQFLPLYLRFIKGVVDSADLPLNVSRELLQQNPELEAMKTALTRRVLDMIGKLAADDSDEGRATYLAFWSEFGAVMKEGLIEDSANNEKLLRLMRFATTQGDSGSQEQSLSDYVGRMADGQDTIYYLVADSFAKAMSSPHLEKLRKSGTEVILFTDKIDPWVVENLREFDGKTFQDAARADLESGDDDAAEAEESEETGALIERVKSTLESRVEAVRVSTRLVDSAACVVAGEQALPPQVRRMLEASGQAMPASKPVLEINAGHPLIERLQAENEDDRFADLANTVLDHALLADGEELDNPGDYVQRVNRLLLANDG